MDQEKGQFEQEAEKSVIGAGEEPAPGEGSLDDTDIDGGGAPDHDATAPADPGLDVDDDELGGDDSGSSGVGGPGLGAPD